MFNSNEPKKKNHTNSRSKEIGKVIAGNFLIGLGKTLHLSANAMRSVADTLKKK